LFTFDWRKIEEQGVKAADGKRQGNRKERAITAEGWGDRETEAQIQGEKVRQRSRGK
jgi:hypothetical protein